MSPSRAATPAGNRRRRPPAKRAAAKRPAAKRPTAKRPTTKRPAAKRPTAKRAAPRRAKATRARPAPRSKQRPRGGLSWTGRILIGAFLLAGLAAGYFLWLRDSSFVAVTDVEVAGLTTSQRGAAVAELTALSEEMSTLNFDEEKIEQAALQYATVAAVDVDPNFPHGVRIEIDERPPRMLAEVGGAKVPVAADGTLLEGVSVDEGTLPVFSPEEGVETGALTGTALEQALIVGAAPAELRPLIAEIRHSDRYGVEVDLEGGVELRFGDGTRPEEKWTAVATVLANSKNPAISYLDVRVPQRPATNGGDAAPDPEELVDPLA